VTRFNAHRGGFTLTELMVVVAILGMLMGIVIMSASVGRSAERMMKSRNHLRQIAQWLDQYASNHRDQVLPARFDYWDEEAIDTDGDGVPETPNANSVGGGRFRLGAFGDSPWLQSANPFLDQVDPRDSGLHQGSWADILWVDANLRDGIEFSNPLVEGALQADVYGAEGHDSVAAPGWWIYDQGDNEFANPLRAAAPNTNNWPLRDANGMVVLKSYADFGVTPMPGDPEGRMAGLPTPVGGGAWEKEMPGFFAANAFFDARSARDVSGQAGDPHMDRYVTHAQVRAPERSVYLVDSFRGETIGESPLADRAVYEARTVDAWTNDIEVGTGITATYSDQAAGQPTQEVDFRYNDGQTTLMMFLDGHVDTQSPWASYQDLVNRHVRVMDLDKRLQQ